MEDILTQTLFILGALFACSGPSVQPTQPAAVPDQEKAQPLADAPTAEAPAAEAPAAEAPSAKPCPPVGTPAWLNAVEAHFGIADPEGHGPDLGSDEWNRVVQGHIGDQDEHGPDLGSDEWQHMVNGNMGCTE